MLAPSRNSPGSVTLALAPRKGMVRLCHSGCLHVTFGYVTLDFHRRSDFDHLCHLVLTSTEEGTVCLKHGHACMCFSPDDFEDFRLLISDAFEELRRLDVVRRLLADLSDGE